MVRKGGIVLKIYGSKLCPDCVAFKKALDANGAGYEFVDITESMQKLKEFLKKRDTDPVFADARENGYVGIPALADESGSITLDWEKYLSDNGMDADGGIQTGAACRIDGTGC